jgi:asparaginyl-tRNA synthetase
MVRASGACENVDTLFEVAGQGEQFWWRDEKMYNSLPAYLAQTGQLYLEAYVPDLEKVYCVGPSFRAEPAIDGRHLSEFMMIEIEFAGGFEDLLQEIEGFIKAIGKRVYRVTGAEHLSDFSKPFSRLTYDQAIEKLKEIGEDINWGDDINSAREKKLVEKMGNGPLFITHFPDPMHPEGQGIEVEKFFNMLPDPDHPGRVLSSDLILPFAGESVGAAARVHIPEVMKDRLMKSNMFKRLQEKGGSLEDFRWYLDRLEQRGSVPHAGCGFGMARILQWLHGGDDITQAVTFPCSRVSLI